jgi:uncharacterized membrane protein YecN with MAPEG domain
MTKLDWVALFTGLNLWIVLVLAVVVVRGRIQHKVTLGDGGNPGLLRAIRAHGNAIEYVPAGMLGLALLAFLEAPPILAVQILGAMFTLGRLLHAFGLSRIEGVSVGRGLGSMLTWAAFAGIAGMLVWAPFAHQL